jgi:phosphoglycerate dehydrogenase-like enzyme
VLAQERRYTEDVQRQRDKFWLGARHRDQFRRVSSLTMGVLGLGDIGSCIARTFSAGFDARILACRARPPPADASPHPHVAEQYGVDRLSEFLSACDYVVSVLPSTPQTRGLLDGDVLQACASRGTSVINVGRGDLLSEQSILRALDQGWLSHYVGDVFAEEPLPASSPLWSHPQVTVTPHCSALTDPADLAAIFAMNFKRYETGQPLRHVFNFDRGY